MSSYTINENTDSSDIALHRLENQPLLFHVLTVVVQIDSYSELGGVRRYNKYEILVSMIVYFLVMW